MLRPLLTLTICVGLTAACQVELPAPTTPATAREYVEASARYHDPEARWPAFAAEIEVATSLGTNNDLAWVNDVYLDRARDTFRRRINSDGVPLVQTVGPTGVCSASWPNPNATPEQLRRNGLLDQPCTFILPRRRFYDFLLGLPMVALEGNPQFSDAVPLVTAFGRTCHEVEVDFADSPTGPTWYLYFEQETYRLHAARFETQSGAGEWLHYPSDVAFGPFTLKASQVWYNTSNLALISRDQLTYRPLER